MAAKRSKAPVADDNLDDLFEGIGDTKASKPSAAAASKSKPAAAATKSKAESEADILADLENQLGAPSSRPHTPRLREVKRTSTNTPPPAANVSAASDQGEDKSGGQRKSAESTSSQRATFTPSATSSELHDNEKRGTVEQQQQQTAGGGGGGGWWNVGGLLATASATATAAMKQAEAAVKEIQQNEEAKKWADQVRGNVGALRGLGDGIRSRALPTFTNILHTLAPPISSHERLLIHITHDMVGYPSLDPLIHAVFSRVMAQVEGGDLLVIQRGHESSIRSPTSEKGPSGGFFSGGSDAGWRDGPWWRSTDSPRDLGVIKGLVEGTKLCRASAEGYAAEYFSQHGGIEAARLRAVEPVSESNPVRSSDLFLAVQAVGLDADATLFGGSSAEEKEKAASTVVSDETDEQVAFAVFVLDPVHEIQYHTLSQAVPKKWIKWMDAAAPLTPTSVEEANVPVLERVPEEIREIVENGGVDPREWVAEWLEEMLSLSVGIVAQRYVARRMGVGEGGIGRGKAREEDIVADGGGEVARAGIL